MSKRLLAGVLVLLFASAAVRGFGQAAASATGAGDSLAATITALDRRLFDAYNHCDLETMGRMVTDDLEFYHDKTGLAVGKQVFLQAIRANICGKVTRELVAGTMEVYPLAGYGAVQMGTHRFHHPGMGEANAGEAKFVVLWQQKDGVWKVARVISYDHEALSK